MNWSSTPPTKPGFYAWRMNEFAMPSPVMVTQTIKGLAAHFYSDLPAVLHKDFSGEWLRLVPAEEVEKLQKRNDDLTASIKKFVHRCEIGEIRSRKTYAEFCALLDVAAPNK